MSRTGGGAILAAGHGDGLPPLREVVRRHGLDARRALGQHFLFDLNLTARIARAGGPLAGVTVVEIGPGPGGLTRALLAEGAARVVAIERDVRFLPVLEEIASAWPGRLQAVHGDALRVNATDLDLKPPVRVIANLPYNVGTELLVRWLTTEPWPPWYDQMILMFQREVAERIVATPESPADYGRLGVLAGWRCETRILFDVPPAAFTPPPRVTSAVVRLVPRERPLPADAAALARVTAAAFGQRRKMLRQSLKSLGVDVGALLATAGIDPTRRAETLDVAAFVRLANGLAALGRPSAFDERGET